MAWVLPFAIGAGATAGYTSGTFAKWAGFGSSNSNGNNNSTNESLSSSHSPQPPQVIVYESSNNGSRNWMIPMSGTALAVLAGYYYYIHKHGTKKVINKVEETSAQTQDLVSKSDKNNEQRFTELDSRNTDRAQTLETEIRGETRAGFQVISEQLYCLSQVCIQTLSAIATGNSDANNLAGEFGNNRVDNNLMSYAESAQEAADTLITEEHLITKRTQNLQDIRAEIYAREPTTTAINSHPIQVTAGGPNDTPMGPDDNSDNNNNNIFNMEANQTPFLTNISYKDNTHDTNERREAELNKQKNEQKGGGNGSRTRRVLNFLKNNEYFPLPETLESCLMIHEIKNQCDNNKYLILCGLFAAGALYSTYDYVFPTNGHSGNAIPYTKYKETNLNQK